MEKASKRPIHELGVGMMIAEELLDASHSIFPVVSHPNRATRKFFGLIRQGMCLKIMHHLELVLNIPKEQIGGREGVTFLCCEEFPGGKCS